MKEASERVESVRGREVFRLARRCHCWNGDRVRAIPVLPLTEYKYTTMRATAGSDHLLPHVRL